MSALNHSNIEEWMFDYHEGNLSDDQKTDLLNFIGKHPEYEEDFMIWGQSQVTESFPDEVDFDQYLKKDNTSAANWRIIAGAASAVILMGAICWFMASSDKPVKARLINKTEIIDSGQRSGNPRVVVPKEDAVAGSSHSRAIQPSLQKVVIEKQQAPEPVQIDDVKEIPAEILRQEPKAEVKVKETAAEVKALTVAPVVKDSAATDVKKQKNNKKNPLQIRMKNTPIND